MLEEYLIQFCSPVLASLKTAGMFCVHQCDSETLVSNVKQWNHLLNPYGLCAMILCEKEDRALVYLFRRSSLLAILKDPEVQEFLEPYGYCRNACHPFCWLAVLKQRLEASDGADFPHEVGIFLGYPLEDVKGFVQHQGRDCKAVGDWKVYGNVELAEQAFCRNRKCTRLYQHLYAGGKTICQLAVAG
ncbi:MAG: DUF3793 family protein [Bulleidia sp.]|nr:DUF3793 family protein [Bulleidia sp.]